MCYLKHWQKNECWFSRIISALVVELVMVADYLAFERALYGFATAFMITPMNALQGVVGMVLALIFIKFVKNNNIKTNIHPYIELNGVHFNIAGGYLL